MDASVVDVAAAAANSVSLGEQWTRRVVVRREVEIEQTMLDASGISAGSAAVVGWRRGDPPTRTELCLQAH